MRLAHLFISLIANFTAAHRRTLTSTRLPDA
jgi:hypothetical protein